MITQNELRTLRLFIKEVVHPAIEKEKAQQNSVSTDKVQTGEAQPVAASKVSTAKTQQTTNGYRVAKGSKQGVAIGHTGQMTTVKWDDGTTTKESGSSIRDLQELVRMYAAADKLIHESTIE